MSSKSRSRKTRQSTPRPAQDCGEIGWYENLDPFDIKPLNRCNPTHLAELVDDMRKNGWHGRQLLVLEQKSGCVDLIGSHRIGAAREVGLSSVPCYVLPEEELLKRGIDLDFHAVMDFQQLRLLRQIGGPTAIRLMWRETRL
jgi:hypothetical protein